MISPPTQLFTAAQIAASLGRAPRAVRRDLDEVPADGLVDTGRGEAKAWRIDSLPKALREDLSARAAVENFRDADGLLRHRSQPAAGRDQKIAELRALWSEAASPAREKAMKWQRALLPALTAYEAGELAGADLEARGLADYAREFGHDKLSARTWRFAFERARERARTPEDWQLPHLFLDENCPRRTEAPAVVVVDHCFQPLHDLIAKFGDMHHPTVKEREALWAAAFKHYGGQMQARRLKSALLDFLADFAPCLAPSRDALRVALARKFDLLQREGTCADKRRVEKKPEVAPAPELVQQAELLAAHAGLNHGGRLAPAFRDLQQRGIMPGVAATSKSYVPKPLRQLARRDAEIVFAHTLGSRGLRTFTPTLTRGPEHCFANDAFVADDFTLPVLCWWEADNERGFDYGPGQTLIMSDFRCWFVLAKSHQPDAQYNSHVVKTLLAKAGLDHGLPRALYFERGQIWQHSRILKGDDRPGSEWRAAHSDAEFEYGLESQLGIRFIHARSPEAKSQIERLGGMLQDLMFAEPGYTGRDQRVDLPEQTRRQFAQVQGGAHPSKFWYHIDQWRNRLDEIIQKYNHTPQDGLWLNGLSPHDAFVSLQRPGDPPTKLDANSWIFLGTQKARRRVREDGMIQIQKSGTAYNYFDEVTTVRLGGEMVQLYWNPEAPEFIGVTDLQGRHPIIVPQVVNTHPLDTEHPSTQAGLAAKGKCAAALKARYSVLPVDQVRQFRPTLVPQATAELSRKMTAAGVETKARRREGESLRQAALRLHEELGRPTALVPARVTREYVESLQAMRSANIVPEETES